MENGVAFCPVPGARYNLVLVSNPLNQRWDFDLLAEHVRERASDVQTAVVGGQAPGPAGFPPAFDLPTMTFSRTGLAVPASAGPVLQGVSLPKAARVSGPGGA